MKLPENLERLSQMTHAKYIGLLMTIVVNLLLLLVALNLNPQAGYYLMMIGFVSVTFAILYIFGWRDGRKLAIIGMGMFLLLGAINGPLVVRQAFNAPQPDPVSSSVHVIWYTRAFAEVEGGNFTTPNAWYRLEQGTVETYKGEAGQSYNFTVMYYSNDTAPPDMWFGYARGVWGLQDAPAMTETDPSDTNYLDGKEYHYAMTIEEHGIYSYWFAAVFATGTDTNSLNTSIAMGPLVGSQVDNWGTYIPIGAVSMFCNIGLLFLIIVLLYWWLGTAKSKRMAWDDALREKEQEAEKESGKDDAPAEPKPFSCDQCGAPVGVNDNFCPKCGDRFDGVEADDEQPSKAGKPREEGASE